MSENTSAKIYYSMGEVCEMFDVNASLIRFWEQKFDVLKPHKNKKGNRLFTVKDLENLKIIYHLVKEKGMTLSGAQVAMKSKDVSLSNDVNVVEKLQEIKSLLAQLHQVLEDSATQEVTVKPAKKEEVVEPLPFIQQSLF